MLSLQTRFLSIELYPFGSSIYTSSNRLPLRKTLSTSSCKIDQFLAAATTKRTLTDVSLATREKVSEKFVVL